MMMKSLIMLAVLLAASQAKVFEVRIDLNNETGHEVGPLFASITIDSHIYRRFWRKFNTSSKQVLTLAKGLHPSRVRIGGTDANFLIFQAEGEPQYDGRGKQSNISVTGAMWTRMIDFLHQVGWVPVIDFNQFLRHRNGDWDPENARQLLEYFQKLHFEIPFFEIGNEASSYYVYNFPYNVSATRLAKDMKQLRKLLSKFQMYNDSGIVGPDITDIRRPHNQEYLEEFLVNGGQDVVSKVGLHHYYQSSRYAKLSSFTDVKVLDSLKERINTIHRIVNKQAPGKPIWFTETSSFPSGGPEEAFADRYAAGFMWLDKLGVSARMGVEVVFRQSFIKGRYSLITDDYKPRTDYFLTLLFKKLVQGKVFHVPSSTSEVRVYANCANPDTYKDGALTVYILNVKNETTTLSFPQYAGQTYDLYLLTPEKEGVLISENVKLNGNVLRMNNAELPDLNPKETSEITFPPYSYGFVVIREDNMHHCKRI